VHMVVASYRWRVFDGPLDALPQILVKGKCSASVGTTADLPLPAEELRDFLGLSFRTDDFLLIDHVHSVKEFLVCGCSFAAVVVAAVVRWHVLLIGRRNILAVLCLELDRRAAAHITVGKDRLGERLALVWERHAAAAVR
jgi:hypothetical protein